MTEQVNQPLNDDDQEPESPLPRWLIILCTLVFTCLFILNIVADIFVKEYSGYPTTALLGLLIGALLGVGKYFRILR